MKTTILWDHDGVLVETEPWYFEATRHTLSQIGITLDKATYLQDMALGRSAWERALAQGFTETQVGEYKAVRNRLYQEYLQTQDIEIPGVTEVLEALGASYQMAIVTTAKKQDFELIHRSRSITRYMAFVLANGDYARSKPHPDPYLAALRRFGVGKEQAVVVEDSERGLRSAVAAGIDCVVVANEFVKGQDFSAATHKIDGLGALAALLESI